jgi:hypothetical protein
LIALWFLPGWLYRISIKSTAWFWWPLIHFGVFLGRVPERAATIEKTELFLKQVRDVKWARLLRWATLFTALAFLGQGVWLFFNSGGKLASVEGTPPPILVLMVILTGMISVPWQAMGLLSNAVGWGVYFWSDKAAAPLEHAVKNKDNKAAQLALKPFRRIAWLALLGKVFSLVYWAGLLGWMVLNINSEHCLRPITPEQRAQIDWAYGKFAPPPLLPGCHPKPLWRT